MKDKTTISCAVSGKPCVWWRKLNHHDQNGDYACHYCIVTGNIRRRGANGECLSRKAPEGGADDGGEL